RIPSPHHVAQTPSHHSHVTPTPPSDGNGQLPTMPALAIKSHDDARDLAICVRHRRQARRTPRTPDYVLLGGRMPPLHPRPTATFNPTEVVVTGGGPGNGTYSL